MYIRRKVYSDFADYNYDYEPQLYSVTMDEDELALFSEFEDAYYEALYSDKGDAAGSLGAAAGLGIAGAGAGAAYYKRHDIKKHLEKKWNEGAVGRAKSRAMLDAKYADDAASVGKRYKNLTNVDKLAIEQERAALQAERAGMGKYFDKLTDDQKKRFAGIESEGSYLKARKAREIEALGKANKKAIEGLENQGMYGKAKKLMEWGKANKKTAAGIGAAGLAGAALLGHAAGKAAGGKD